MNLSMLERAEDAHYGADQPGIIHDVPTTTGPKACPECQAPPGAPCEAWCPATTNGP